ncbi:hypothetical protein H0H93_002477, partial [Arthromyces matolae]
IRATPLLQNKAHPDFVSECTQTLQICNNLQSFVYTPSSTAVIAILPTLSNKERLKVVRINAKLSTSQASALLNLKNVEKLELDKNADEFDTLCPFYLYSPSIAGTNGWM